MKPCLSFPTETLLKAQAVKVVFLDVDGVLTDGGLYFTEHGETIKRFSTLDGHGLKLLQSAGITPVVITGRDSKPLRVRLGALGISHARYGVEEKKTAAEELLKLLGVDWSDAAAMGDDWPDLAIMNRCKFSCAPPNAHEEVKASVDHVTTTPAGAGAVRELCDLLLMATGRYAALLRESAK